MLKSACSDKMNFRFWATLFLLQASVQTQIMSLPLQRLHLRVILQPYTPSWASPVGIPSSSPVVEPLRALLRGNSAFTWTDAAQVAFSRVKELIASSPALTLFDPVLPTLVTTDACDYGIGAVLTQLHGDSEKTVAFASRSLTECEESSPL